MIGSSGSTGGTTCACVEAAPNKAIRSFYSATVVDFLSDNPSAIVGQLASRHVAFHAAAEAEQLRAWERQIELLRTALIAVGEGTSGWSILLECPLLRLGRRLDTVILASGMVIVIEFKIGAKAYDTAAREQVSRYAQCLRDFHEASQSRLVVPMLCAENAPSAATSADVVLCNGQMLGEALATIARDGGTVQVPLDPISFDLSPYRPTPTIVEAAQALYAGHQIVDIGRGDATDAELQAAAETLQAVVEEAERARKKVICFVTGAPGAGKTLLGLDLALKSRSGDRPAALLSGNRPLVHVLTTALAADHASRTAASIADAKYQADAAIQNLLGYLKEHTDGAAPPEHVIVFDEAQRAWDEEVGQELMGRPNSEPELFLNILDRLDWSCLICLVGPGQEINRGEGGLPLWGQALSRAAASGRRWEVIAAPPAIIGGPEVTGPGLQDGDQVLNLSVRPDPRLHLANSIRAFRNPLRSQWVPALLGGDIDAARQLASKVDEPPAYLTRDLKQAKSWLRKHRSGGRSVGLLASSGAVRLVGDGIPPAPRSNELASIGHWFLKPYIDFRSAGALEVPMSEFGCQGLELDFVGLCWGGDLIWREVGWVPRMMRAPRWQIIREEEKKRFRLNAYRVLLTRARAGVVIFVPPGSHDDPTRPPAEADDVVKVLQKAGCRMLGPTE